jgi:hypothetical protein
MASEPVTSGFEFFTKLLKVIDLTVEDHDEVAAMADHRLMAFSGKIQDGEATMAKRNTGFRINP